MSEIEKDLVEVEPCKSKELGRTVWFYDSINVYRINLLAWHGLRDSLNEQCISGKFQVAEREGNYFIKFLMKKKAKPTLVILEEDGRLYTYKDNWKNEDMRNLARHGAGILIEILNRLHLVYGARKRYFSWKLYPIDKYGYAPKEDTPRLAPTSKWTRESPKIEWIEKEEE